MADRNNGKNNEDHSRDKVRRIILIGKTGNGKSSTGNSLLRYPGFIHEKGTCSVTQSCEVRTSAARKDWPLYKVCDTPGLLDTDSKVVDRILEIQRSVKVLPEPHVFLLVFSSASRMTEDERFTVDLLRIMFGEDVFEQCIVVFTRGDEFASGAEFQSFLEGSPMLERLLEQCGNRVARVENKNTVDNANNGTGISPLLALVEQVSCDGQRAYTYSSLILHTDVLKRYRHHFKGNDDIGSILTDISVMLGRELKNNRWKVALVGATAIGGVGVVGYGAYAASVAAINAVPAIGAAIGSASGRAVGGYIGGFVKMAAVGFARNVRFW